LLISTEVFDPNLNRSAAQELYGRLRAFQNEYQDQHWGPVRSIRNRDLFLIEDALRIYLGRTAWPTDGYRLAVSYCESYDSRYGNGLNAPSLVRVEEVIQFVHSINAIVDANKKAA
jgi:hypothetical protein